MVVLPQQQEEETIFDHTPPPFLTAPGLYFHPTDSQLIQHYLLPRIKGTLHPIFHALLVRECDLYGSQDPWEIWASFTAYNSDYLDTAQGLYFFTDLKKKQDSNKRFTRKVGNGGTWHGENGSAGHHFQVKIDATLEITAFKKSFTYRNPGSDQHCCWSMNEYSVPSRSPNAVLCQLIRKGKGNDNNIDTNNRKMITTTKKRKRVASATAFPDAAVAVVDDDAPSTVQWPVAEPSSLPYVQAPLPKRSRADDVQLDLLAFSSDGSAICTATETETFGLNHEQQEDLVGAEHYAAGDDGFTELEALLGLDDLSFSEIVGIESSGSRADPFAQTLLQENSSCHVPSNNIEMIPIGDLQCSW